MPPSRIATDKVLLRTIGHRIARLRVERNLTQLQLAEQAGISKRSLERLETGSAATQLSGFLRVCRVLGLLERLDLFVPEPAPSPIAQLELRGKQRRRASRSASRRAPAKSAAPAASPTWQWADTTPRTHA